jgi:hypothetical protein
MTTAKQKVHYAAKSHDASGIVVIPMMLPGPSLVVTPDPNGFLGVAVVLPPPPPEKNVDPERCTFVAYIGNFIGSTTVNIPGGGTAWTQVFLVYLPDGVGTPNIYDAISKAIKSSTSPWPTDGTGE